MELNLPLIQNGGHGALAEDNIDHAGMPRENGRKSRSKRRLVPLHDRAVSDEGLFQRQETPGSKNERRRSYSSLSPGNGASWMASSLAERFAASVMKSRAGACDANRITIKPQCRYLLAKEQAEGLRSFKKRTAFLPASPFLAFWDMLMFCCLIGIGMFEPYVFVFDVDSVASEIFYWTSSAFYMVDTFLRFFRAQRKSTCDGIVLVTYLPEIARMYMKDWMFYIDTISAFPVTVIVTVLGDQKTRTGRILSGVRMIRLLKFARLPGLLHRVHEVFGWSFTVLSIAQFALMSAMVLHWIACLWASLASFENRSWVSHVSENYDFLEFVDNRDTYLMSLYWSVTVLSSVGFGDITPQQRHEFMVAIICMVVGGTVWAFVVGSVCGLATSMDKHRIAFESLVNDVTVMCAERHFPPALRSRVWDYYQHAKEFMRMQKYHETIRSLSPALKGEVVSWMYGSCFKRVWYFDVVDERCARLLTEGMVPRMYAPEEWIEDTDHGIRCLLFLRSGLCVRKNNLLAPGACWGLDVILGSEEHHDIESLLDKELARSINFVFVLELSKISIDRAATLIPAFARRLRKAHLRMLFWRGVIAATRATKRLQRPAEIQHSDTPAWDKAGRMMAQIVHKDCLLLQEAQAGCTPKKRRSVACMSDTTPKRRGSKRACARPSDSMVAQNLFFPEQQRQQEHTQKPGASKGAVKTHFDENNLASDATALTASIPNVSAIEKGKSSQQSSEWDFALWPLPSQNSLGWTSDEAKKTFKDNSAEEKVQQSNHVVSSSHEIVASLQSWREQIDKRLEELSVQMQVMRAEMAEDIGGLRDEVSELTKLMHLLLSRLAAEEKY